MKRLIRLAVLMVVAATAVLVVVTVAGVRWIERASPPVGQFVEVGGTRLHYTDQGTGPPIVLIHGASSNLLEFQTSLVPILAREFRVLTFDRPGFGYSARLGGDWPDPGTLAELVLSASEALGVQRPVIVGHSWAGAVVMSALVREPDRVAGGVLLAGVAGHWVGERSAVERLRDWPAVNTLFAHTLVLPVGLQLVPGALASVFAPSPVPDGQADRVGARLVLRPESYLANGQDLERLSAFLQRESTRYRDIRKPLLAIHGTADELVPFWNHGERLQAVIPNLDVVLIEGAGHALHHTHTDEVASHIATFVLRHAQSPKTSVGRCGAS